MNVLMFSLMLLLVVNGACTSARAPRVIQEPVQTQSAISPSPPMNTPQTDSIRSVDFANFTYDWYPKWELMLSKATHFTLRDGKLEVEAQKNSNEPVLFELLNVQYGDVSEDGVEDAIVTIKMSVVGNAKPYVVFVIGLKNGKPKKLWVHETGDRADEGLRNVYVADGVLVIEQYNAAEIEIRGGEKEKVGMCCPSTFTRTFYRWVDARFQTVRKENLQNEYPDARVLVRPDRISPN